MSLLNLRMTKLNDDLAYYLIKRRFKQETDDIIHSYRHMVTEEIQELYIRAIKAEYKRR